jgi:hypothetical protein
MSRRFDQEQEIDQVEMEYYIGSKYRVDVACLVRGKVILAIEVRDNCPVSLQKLWGIPVPLIEVDVVEIIKRPTCWVSLLDNLPFWHCNHCEKLQEELAYHEGRINQLSLPFIERLESHARVRSKRDELLVGTGRGSFQW